MAEPVTSVSWTGMAALWIALIWLGLCVAGAAGVVLFQRLLIMWQCGHGWADAGVLLRRRAGRARHARSGLDEAVDGDGQR